MLMRLFILLLPFNLTACGYLYDVFGATSSGETSVTQKGYKCEFVETEPSHSYGPFSFEYRIYEVWEEWESPSGASTSSDFMRREYYCSINSSDQINPSRITGETDSWAGGCTFRQDDTGLDFSFLFNEADHTAQLSLSSGEENIADYLLECSYFEQVISTYH